ncbi:MAG: SDR family oxidoreductase [Algicola sp.]|nr:SDR family oxidoreductase [Algicola sp.]
MTQNNKTTLVAGASGATGKHVVEQLLQRNHKIKIVVRSKSRIPNHWKNNKSITITEASILNLLDLELQELVKECDGIVSCLGHNLTLKGLYGHPRRLVTNAVSRLSESVIKNDSDNKVKFVLMNTSGNRNRDLDEPISFAQRSVIFLLRCLLPPHVDNEKAAEFFRTRIGQHHTKIEWVAVRPDGLVNEDDVSDYDVFPSPVRSAIFNAGKVSRINVAHFIATLIASDETWRKWKGQMPVVYNKE